MQKQEAPFDYKSAPMGSDRLAPIVCACIGVAVASSLNMDQALAQTVAGASGAQALEASHESSKRVSPAPPSSSESAEGRTDPAVSAAVARLVRLARERFDRSGPQRDPEALQGALRSLKLARALSPAPSLIFNTAVVEERLGNCSEARALYRGFLEVNPGSEHRARAEAQLLRLGVCPPLEPSLVGWLLPGVALPLLLPAFGEWHAYRHARLARLGGDVQGNASDSLPAGVDAAASWDTVSWLLTAGTGVSAVLAGVFLGQTIYWAGRRDNARDNVRNAPEAEQDARIARYEATLERGEQAQWRARILGIASLGCALTLGAWLLPNGEQGAEPEHVELSLQWAPGLAGARLVRAF